MRRNFSNISVGVIQQVGGRANTQSCTGGDEYGLRLQAALFPKRGFECVTSATSAWASSSR
jgi:hypothetical protein